MKQREKRAGQTASSPPRDRVRAMDTSLESVCVCVCCEHGLCERQWREMRGGEKNAEEEKEESSGAQRERVADLCKITF